ncbi:acyltransferase family protein [Vagococcus sp. JNUCC 83]
MTVKRDYRIDFLRALAIILIMLAHTNLPNLLFNIRVFDVVLMTMLMSMSFVLTYKPNETYKDYVIKRLNRLIIPAWIFLSIFFIVFTIINIFVAKKYNFNLKSILGSYSLISGIGYVWIIRIFFTIALFNPLLLKVSRLTNKMYSKLSLISILLIIQYMLATYAKGSNGIKKLIFDIILSNSFGYLIVALIGMYIIKQTKKENLLLLLYSFIIFIIGLFSTNGGAVSQFKYPPFPYYLSYGVLMSLILWMVISNKKILPKLNNRYTNWLSYNSLNLYYWHIIPVFTIQHYFSSTPNLFIQILLVFSFAIIMCLIQNKYFKNLFNIKLKPVEL